MNWLKFILLIILFNPLIVSAQTIGEFTDERDNQVYKTVTIAGKVWMAENLNYKTERSWCYSNKQENCDTYGRLYNQDAALNACPMGWHLPSDEEWQELEKELGMQEGELSKVRTWRGTDQGEKLRTDSLLGFNILLAGYRNPPSNNMLLGSQAFFWTSTIQNGQGYFRQFYKGSPKIFRRTRPKSWAFSIRCVKDSE